MAAARGASWLRHSLAAALAKPRWDEVVAVARPRRHCYDLADTATEIKGRAQSGGVTEQPKEAPLDPSEGGGSLGGKVQARWRRHR